MDKESFLSTCERGGEVGQFGVGWGGLSDFSGALGGCPSFLILGSGVIRAGV